MTDKCRYPGCSDPARDDVDGVAGRFCSAPCEVKYDHIRADAQDRRRGERR